MSQYSNDQLKIKVLEGALKSAEGRFALACVHITYLETKIKSENSKRGKAFANQAKKKNKGVK